MLFSKTNFSQKFQKIYGKDLKKTAEIFFERFKISSKQIIYGKNNLFRIIFENYFQIIKSLNIDQWQLDYDYFRATSKADNSYVS